MNKIENNKGFTLPEMLVSSAIGALILAALFISFIMFNRSYELQREMTRNQENGRMALDYMVEEIRNAGYEEFNAGSPVPINQAIILESPIFNNIPVGYRGALPTDCGERISFMYDIVPSENDMNLFSFVRRRVSYFGESYNPGGNVNLTRCRLMRDQCHRGYLTANSSFAVIANNTKYPCNQPEVVLDYLYELSFGLSDYKYDAVAGRMNPITPSTRRAAGLFNYALAPCVNSYTNFTNIACPQYTITGVGKTRSLDMYLSIISGKEISTVEDDPVDDPDKGRRFLSHYQASMVLRN